MMSRIRGRDTKPELALRKLLHRMGFRYRTHGTTLPGRPDLVFAKYRAVVFVHGCFWHRHFGCDFATTPASNTAFWQKKFSGTVERDSRSVASLMTNRWRVAIVWECAIEDAPERAAAKISTWLLGSKATLELG